MLPKANVERKKITIYQIFHKKKIQKVLMKIEEMADIFLNSANFAPHALLTLAPPSDLLRSSFERKIAKTNFIPEKNLKTY